MSQRAVGRVGGTRLGRLQGLAGGSRGHSGQAWVQQLRGSEQTTNMVRLAGWGGPCPGGGCPGVQGEVEGDRLGQREGQEQTAVRRPRGQAW